MFWRACGCRKTRASFRHATLRNGKKVLSCSFMFFTYDTFKQQKEQLGTNNAPSSIDQNCTFVSATWDPTESSFEPLNIETPKDHLSYMTIAVDLVIRGIQEPVRFQIETPVRVFSSTERFWYFQKRSLIQQFFLNLKEVGKIRLYMCPRCSHRKNFFLLMELR